MRSLFHTRGFFFGLCLTVSCAVLSPASGKSVVGGGVEGAIHGAILGRIFGGDKKSAERGAKIGAAIGALKAAEQNRRQREAREREILRIQQERLALEREMASAREVMSRPALPPAGDLVKKVQRSLIILEYLAPPVSGFYDEALREAIVSYQSSHGLVTNGKPSLALVQHLRRNGG